MIYAELRGEWLFCQGSNSAIFSLPTFLVGVNFINESPFGRVHPMGKQTGSHESFLLLKKMEEKHGGVSIPFKRIIQKISDIVPNWARLFKAS